MNWFSVRCIFRHEIRGKPRYEERIILIQATDLDHALVLGEKEAQTYGESSDCLYCGLAQAYEMRVQRLENGVETFSLMRESELDPDEYLTRFFDTGAERQQDFESRTYEGSYLFDVVVGVEPMTRELSRQVWFAAELESGDFEKVARKLTRSTLGVAEAWEMGRALVEKARDFLGPEGLR